MAKETVNFTKEHQDELNALILKHFYKNTQFASPIGSDKANVLTLFHNLTIKSLQDRYITAKKAAQNVGADDWSKSDYEQRQQKEKEEIVQLLHLMIGYKKAQSEKDAARQELSDLKAELRQLEESTKTPAEKLAEIKERIKAAESVA
jgi:predicted nuclease with TOPRIM domain